MKKALNLLFVIFTLILLLGNVSNIKQVNGETTSRVHFVCEGSCSHNGSHSNITFTALPSDFTGGLLNAGNYYLTQNIYLTQPITFSKDAIVNLCFNGY